MTMENTQDAKQPAIPPLPAPTGSGTWEVFCDIATWEPKESRMQEMLDAGWDFMGCAYGERRWYTFWKRLRPNTEVSSGAKNP